MKLMSVLQVRSTGEKLPRQGRGCQRQKRWQAVRSVNRVGGHKKENRSAATVKTKVDNRFLQHTLAYG